MKKIIAAYLFSIICLVSQGSVTITPTSLPNGFVKHPYSQTLNANGGVKPYVWSVLAGTLPTGLSITSGTQVSTFMTGTPSASGTFTFTIKVTDAKTATATATYTINISQNILTAPQITTSWFRCTPDFATLWDTWQSCLNRSSDPAWYLIGNTGTSTSSNFLGTIDEEGLVIKTFNVERMRILSSGNVGINTDAPSEKLEVKGGNINMNRTSTSTIAGSVYSTSDVNKWFVGATSAFSNNDYVIFNYTNNQSNIVLTEDAKMSIGTLVEPAVQLDVANHIRVSNNLVPSYQVMYSSGADIMEIGNGANQNIIGYKAGKELAFGTITDFGLTGYDQKMVLDLNGQLGIGIAIPTSTLHVVGSAKFATTHFNLSALANYATNADALTAGLVAGDVYYTDTAGEFILKLVH